MKPIREYQNQLAINPTECSSSISYLSKQPFDFDVFLSSRGRTLQRPFVWTLDQKRELIHSLIIGKHIPHVSLINKNDSFEVIDGKQRLGAIFGFLKDEFSIILEENEYLFSQLPEDYQNHFNRGCRIRYYVAYESDDKKITDDDKINWFKFINFAGTPQDKEYMENLK